MEIPRETPWKIAENRTLKRVSSPPRAKTMRDKWFTINNLHGFIKMAGRLSYPVLRHFDSVSNLRRTLMAASGLLLDKPFGLVAAANSQLRVACRRRSLPGDAFFRSGFINSLFVYSLPGLADFPINRIGELTPRAWAARSS